MQKNNLACLPRNVGGRNLLEQKSAGTSEQGSWLLAFASRAPEQEERVSMASVG
jgi:hypothetical protein